MAKNYGAIVYRKNKIASVHVYESEKRAQAHVTNVNKDDKFGLSAVFTDSVIFWDTFETEEDDEKLKALHESY